MSKHDVQFCDEAKLKIEGVSLIIDVNRIKEKFHSIQRFGKFATLPAVTNGRVLKISLERKDESRLNYFCAHFLIPNGFEAIQDFAMVREKYTCAQGDAGYYHDPYLWREFKELNQIHGVKGLVTPYGNYVWHRDDEEDLFYSIERMQYLLVQYVGKYEPDKLRFRPKIQDVNRYDVCFGMFKHHGVMHLSTQSLLEIGSQFSIR
jgi:hypothetical protein